MLGLAFCVAKETRACRDWWQCSLYFQAFADSFLCQKTQHKMCEENKADFVIPFVKHLPNTNRMEFASITNIRYGVLSFVYFSGWTVFTHLMWYLSRRYIPFRHKTDRGRRYDQAQPIRRWDHITNLPVPCGGMRSTYLRHTIAARHWLGWR